jgi:hypothetical protein
VADSLLSGTIRPASSKGTPLPGVLRTMIMLTVTPCTLYDGDRYVHHDHDGALPGKVALGPLLTVQRGA